MNTNPLPKPNGTPARMGEIQCMDGFAVHENQNSPIGINTLPMQTAITAASGAGRPVVGSWEQMWWDQMQMPGSLEKL